MATAKKQGVRWGMVVDTRRCVGCNACVLGCMAENKLPENSFRDWIVTETTGIFPHLQQEIRSERCNHCDNPPCVDCCPTGASHVVDGGIVLVDDSMCTGCKACIKPCPTNAITGEKKELHVIHQDDCISCGVCRDVCRFNSVVVV